MGTLWVARRRKRMRLRRSPATSPSPRLRTHVLQCISDALHDGDVILTPRFLFANQFHVPGTEEVGVVFAFRGLEAGYGVISNALCVRKGETLTGLLVEVFAFVDGLAYVARVADGIVWMRFVVYFDSSLHTIRVNLQYIST